MALVGKEFNERLEGYLHVWLPARYIVEKSLKVRKEVTHMFIAFKSVFLAPS